ncbi:MAG: hypothetical protein NTX79_04855 [Candidatus Micrarchaeota archaeon]|nr:hypothetical protein [Candidatus Micrarchaeota archaeon]
MDAEFEEMMCNDVDEDAECVKDIEAVAVKRKPTQLTQNEIHDFAVKLHWLLSDHKLNSDHIMLLGQLLVRKRSMYCQFYTVDQTDSELVSKIDASYQQVLCSAAADAVENARAKNVRGDGVDG